ncbi:hypothetical protein M885DRAFT_612421 [Pelagophyceae sp. CCMP2097]|nr:hypothetical protein M885DRAFT_612421 [Pelagophyceae sp. CCMP2097]|mmetsp:Transcript_19693/g.66614  ORF Transcript_19693/g.66614 Transcript_19693/m.66614 type:complete len:392 (-) Transcript_19693:111-1286(-)
MASTPRADAALPPRRCPPAPRKRPRSVLSGSDADDVPPRAEDVQQPRSLREEFDEDEDELELEELQAARLRKPVGTPQRPSMARPQSAATVGPDSPDGHRSPDRHANRGSPERRKPSAAPWQTPQKPTPVRARATGVECDAQTQQVYAIVRKATGQIGGNGDGGAIYGEITMQSFQRVVDILKAKCGLDARSSFIDVGSGLGKPNFHVAADPGVEFSYGIEMEKVRWELSMHNLVQVNEKIKSRCYFAHGNITAAKTFDPFTHVYMFDVGFPPPLLGQLATMFNQSATAKCLITYQAPRIIIDEHGFEVTFLERISTSMHGSSERHSCYVYTRGVENRSTKCDAYFAPARQAVAAKDEHDFLSEVRRRLDMSQNEAPRRKRSPPPRFVATH